MTKTPSLQDFAIGGKTSLDFSPPWPDKVHQFERKEAVAIMAALFSGRPLLVEGAPGSGKTQLAAAAAAALDRELITFVVNSHTKPEDLLWHYDALQRLNDAQANDKGVDKIERYLSKGPVWQAFEQNSQEGEHAIAPSIQPYQPTTKGNQNGARGKVILIDEIDKADRSVPNSLLDVFGHRRFYCPHLRQEIIDANHGENDAPLMIITSNREQQLPPAFVRRCLILRLALPKDEAAFVDQLVARAELHFGDSLTPKQYRQIASQLWKVRAQSGLPEAQQPGQAEYFDLVRAISEALKEGVTDEAGAKLSFDDLLQEMHGLALGKSNVEYSTGA